MPMVLDWAPPPGGLSFRPSCPSQLRFTTIGNWQQPGENEWNGEVYAWSKHHQFLKFMDLPRRLGQPVELALGSVDSDSIELLVGHDWRVIDACPFGQDLMPVRDYTFLSGVQFRAPNEQNVSMRAC